VNLWGSHPSQDNDDCWTGVDFETEEQALRAFANPTVAFSKGSIRDTAYIELEGPNLYKVRKNLDYVPSQRDDDDDWLRDTAQQLGMGLGVKAYNDAIGF
jgi:hypothetical protein